MEKASLNDNCKGMSKYEVHATQGQGDFLVDEFATLEEALKCCENKNDMCCGIILPNGEWYKWMKEN